MNIVKYETDINVELTSSQGTVNTTYDKIVSIMGEPDYLCLQRDEKINCGWSAKVTYQDPLSDDPADTKTARVSLYNWCTETIPYELYPWHIGGDDLIAEEIVNAIIREEIKPVE